MRDKIAFRNVKHLVESGVYLTTKQAAIYLGLTERTLETYRDTGKGPSYVKYPSMVRYPPDALNDYLRLTAPQHGTSRLTKTKGSRKISPCQS